MSSLTIKSSNYANNNALVVNYRDRNTDTSLVLHGPDAYNYGQDLLTNLVWLTEHFCNTDAPTKPVLGQTYYNSNDKLLYVNTSTGWNPITLKPNTDSLDIVHLTKPSIHSERVLSNELNGYMSLSGNDKPVGIKLYDTITDKVKQAVTKHYVDTVLSDNVAYLPKTGIATMSGPLLLKTPNKTDNALSMVNVQYVNGLGELDTVSNNLNVAKHRITTYRVQGLTNAEDNLDTSDWFTTVWFNDEFADGSATVTITLPFAYNASSVKGTDYHYSMIVTCNSIDTHEPLLVNIASGSQFTITRKTTTGALKINGSVYGFRTQSQNILG